MNSNSNQNLGCDDEHARHGFFIVGFIIMAMAIHSFYRLLWTYAPPPPHKCSQRKPETSFSDILVALKQASSLSKP